jgi:SAM-dependent methyltransferase
MSLYSRILGHPFVYNRIRPAVVGGIDMSAAYERLATDGESTVLDIGCGTGNALDFLGQFKVYKGLDTDETAVRFAKRKYGDRPNVSFERRTCSEQDVSLLQPSHVVMAGLLHHLDDAAASELLTLVAQSSRLVRAITIDIIFLRGEFYNNLLARLDRGRYCRTESQYHALVARSRLTLAESIIVRSHPKNYGVKYLVMTLTPAGRAPEADRRSSSREPTD